VTDAAFNEDGTCRFDGHAGQHAARRVLTTPATRFARAWPYTVAGRTSDATVATHTMESRAVMAHLVRWIGGDATQPLRRGRGVERGRRRRNEGTFAMNRPATRSSSWARRMGQGIARLFRPGRYGKVTLVDTRRGRVRASGVTVARTLPSELV